LKQNRNLECADKFAPDYDQVVLANGWCTPEVISGLISGYVSNGDRLLDIGIGTGLSAIQFKNKGLTIYGVDGSAEMLKICDAKKLTTKLDLCDLSRDRLPYSDTFFNHVISTGVFHLLCDLDELFSEISRVLRKGGLFCFTVDERTKGSINHETVQYDVDIEEYESPKSKIKSYKHSETYITELFLKNSFVVRREKSFRAYRKTEWADELYFKAYLTEKE